MAPSETWFPAQAPAGHVSIVSGLTTLARQGVLIKGGVILETEGKLRALAVDKTGKITQGRPSVAEIIPWGGTTEEEVLRPPAAIDTHSTHPWSEAVTDPTKARGISFAPADNYQSRTGGARRR